MAAVMGCVATRPDQPLNPLEIFFLTYQKIVFFETFTKSLLFKVLSNAQICLVFVLLNILGRLFGVILDQVQPEQVESEDVQEHPPNPRVQKVSRLDKDAERIGTGPLESSLVPRDRKRHVGWVRGDSNLSEKVEKVGISGRVADDLQGQKSKSTAVLSWYR